MYEKFYQLESNPFSLAPDPHFCFSHAGHQQAREYLEYALNLGEGMVMITGRPGNGKTTLVESFLSKMRNGAVVAAHMAASQLDPDDLLRAVAYAFDIGAEGQDRATLRFRIRNYLKSLHEKGKRALLVIDEAQGLPYAALDELRLLADLQIDSQQLLQLFLVGQEPLHELLAKPEMDFFQQRVIASYQLVPLDLQETRDYIEYRLTRAGWQGRPAFTGAAVRDINQYTAGVPRHINKLCNRLLLLGYGKGCQTIGHREVRTIADEMGSEWLQPVEMQRVANGGMAMAPGSKPTQSRNELDKLAIRRKQRATMSVVRSNPADDSQTTAMAANTDMLEAPPEPDIEPAPESGAVAVPASQPADGRHDLLRLRTVQAALVLLVAGLVFAGLNRTVSMPEAGVPQTGEVRPQLAAEQEAREGKRASGLPGMPGLEAAAMAASGVALPQVADEELPAQATSGLTAGPATVAEPPQLLVHAPAARADDLQDPHAGDRQTTGSKVGTVKDEVGPPQVADEELPAQAANGLAAEPDTLAEPPLLEAYVSSARAEDLQDTQVADRHAIEASVIAVEADSAGVESRQVANTELSVPVTGPLRADEATDTDTLPVEMRAHASPADELPGLLAAAQQAFAEHRLLMPPGDSAYHYFQSALLLAPGNAEAIDGIDRIVQRYIALSIQMLEEQNDLMAKRFINRGLRIQPDNATLLALREKSVAAVAPAQVTPEAMPSPQVSSEPVDASPGETVVDDERFFSRVKGFLKEQGRAEMAGEPDYAMTSSFVYE
jgi:type II secretory pathway predicted ATPase ExeA